MRGFLLCLIAAGSLAGFGCSESGLIGDSETTDTGDSSSDTSIDRPADWVPDAGSGRLVPEGEATFYESDVGEDFSGFGLELLPIAFSGTVYTMLVVEDASTPGTDDVAAYRMAPGGDVLETTWFGEVPAVLQPSICWTGEVFAASFPIRGEGNRVLAITEAGEHVGTATVGAIDTGDPCDWSAGDAKHIMCPSTGPLIVDFMQPGLVGSMDTLHIVNADGTATGTEIEVDLPPPASGGWRPGCFTVGASGACFTGEPPLEKMSVYFFDRDGNVWGTGNFPDTAHFEMGSAMADVGGAAAAFWLDTPDWGDHIELGFSLLGLDGSFIVPPMSTGLAMVRDDEMGLRAASSGSDILVVGREMDERGVESGTYLYLFDLAGNLLDDPLRLEPLLETEWSTQVFWEGDAYAVIWNESGGIYYRRYIVE